MRGMMILCWVLIAGCGSKKKEATSCEAVASHLTKLDVGRLSSFLTDKERARREKRWIATCEPMSEATRKCVLAATTKKEADACSGGGSAAGAEGESAAETGAKAAWILRGGDASDQVAQFVAFVADGDVVVAGDMDGTIDMGGQLATALERDAWVARLSPTGTVRWIKSVGGKGIEYVKGLGIGADDSVLLAVQSDVKPRFSRVMLASDGGTIKPTPIATDRLFDAAALHANGDLVVGSRALDPVKGDPCPAGGFVVQRFAAGGKRLWSRCNDSGEFSLTDERMRLAAGPDGMTAACGVFSGALAWGGEAAPESETDAERAFVLALGAKGEQRWVDYVITERKAFCDDLAVMDDGSVAAIVHGTELGSMLVIWDSDGARWSRKCWELLDKEECELTAVAGNGSDVVVAAQSGAMTAIATIDRQTGAITQVSQFPKGMRMQALAARAGTLVFATGFSGTANFGAGPLESEGSSLDALVGRL